jgi:hypothetical protein
MRTLFIVFALLLSIKVSYAQKPLLSKEVNLVIIIDNEVVKKISDCQFYVVSQNKNTTDTINFKYEVGALNLVNYQLSNLKKLSNMRLAFKHIDYNGSYNYNFVIQPQAFLQNYVIIIIEKFKVGFFKRREYYLPRVDVPGGGYIYTEAIPYE